MKSTSRSHKELENEQENAALPEFESELSCPALKHQALPANVLDMIRAHSKSTHPRISPEQKQIEAKSDKLKQKPSMTPRHLIAPSRWRFRWEAHFRLRYP